MGTTFRCRCSLQALAIISLFVAFSFGAEQPDEPVTPQGNPEWVEIPAAEAGLPSIAVADLIRRVKEANAKGDRADRWEMRYHVKQVPNPDQHHRNQKTDAMIHLARSGEAWRFDASYNDPLNAKYSTEYYVTGNQVTNLMHQAKSINLRNDVAEVRNYRPLHPLLPFLLPGIEPPVGVMPDQFTPGRVCDLIASLDNPGTKRLSWCTKVDGKTCYVVETSSKVTMPIFRDDDEWKAWTKANPAEWERCRLGGLGVVVDPSASGDQTAYAKRTHRIAVDPANGFRIVRWSKGTARGVGDREWIRVFHDVLYSFNRQFGVPHVPDEVLVSQYQSTPSGKGVQFIIENRLVVKEFSTTPDAACFEPPPFPEGYRVFDAVTGIAYRVGDRPELIGKLRALAEHRNAFYDRLCGMEQLPALKAASWLNSDPIDLKDCRGRIVDLYFWGIGCAPCMQQLPQIEEEFQRSRQTEGSPRIILIHGHVPEAMVEKVKSVLEKKGITIPCMIDTPFKGRTWGQTHADYGVQSVPTRIRIGADGKIVTDGRTLINAHDLETSLFAPKQEK